MIYLLEHRGEVRGDLSAEARRQGDPDFGGFDRHGSCASPATVSRSRSASTLSLQAIGNCVGWGTRFVAASGSVRNNPAS
jgi:hypothetical protein